MLTAATMFSGIGAPEVAMPHWRWPWHAEIEKFPAAVMADRHPDSVNLGDVSADDFAERGSEIARPDVLIFGSPCQDFSVAGRRAGLAGKRGNLSMVALDILGRLRPEWFVFENVPGLLSIDGGRGFRWFLRRVDELGYLGSWASLDAQYFGLAQRRQRVFFVGHSRDWRYPAAVLLEPESLRGHHPPRRQKGEGIAPTIASRPTGGGGLGTDFDCDGGLVSHALNAKGGAGRSDYESETFVTHALRADGFDASEDGTGRGTPLVADTVRSHPRPGSNSLGLLAFSSKDYGADVGSIAPTLRAMGHSGSHANAGGQVAVTYSIMPQNSGKDYKARVVDVAQPLMASGPVGGNQGGDYIAGSSVRRLTPRECERLQGFPDDYTLIEYRKKPAADGPRYKALGNSMAVPVMRWILSRIEQMSQHRQ